MLFNQNFFNFWYFCRCSEILLIISEKKMFYLVLINFNNSSLHFWWTDFWFRDQGYFCWIRRRHCLCVDCFIWKNNKWIRVYERRRYEEFLLCSPIFLNSCEIISLRYKKDGCCSWDWEKESKVMLQTRK